MLTAALPVRLAESPFWSSEKGMICIDKFLSGLTAIPEIDRIFMLSTDNQTNNFTKKYNITVLRADGPGEMDGPYTFAQTMDLARYFHHVCSESIDDLIIVDHRNLCLTANDIEHALSIYGLHRSAGVISVSLCMDHPCQWRSYFSFVGCTIFHFQGAPQPIADPECPMKGLQKIIKSPCSDFGDITVSVHLKNGSWRIGVDCQMWPANGLIAHVVPFNSEGPQYGDSQEIPITGTDIEILQDIDSERLSGMVVTLVTFDPSGSYDTIECFTPEKADWELGAFGSTVVDKNSQAPIYGRQQFTPVYIYDGSFCVVNAETLHQKNKMNPVPAILKRSCIATDWVDYWHYASRCPAQPGR